MKAKYLPYAVLAAFLAAGLGALPMLSQGIALRFTPVVNAPFSAEVVEEYSSTSPRGKETTSETHGGIYRDSQGRLRTETVYGGSHSTVTGTDGSRNTEPEAKSRHQFVSISISDPLRHLQISLTSANKIARVTSLQVCSPSDPGKPSASTAKQAPVETRQIGPMKSVRENLGTKMIDGLIVIGKRHTLSEIRELKEHSTMTETWYSPDLQLDVLTVEESSGGDRSVSHTRQLMNIQRSEPSADMFQVPQGYEVRKR